MIGNDLQTVVIVAQAKLLHLLSVGFGHNSIHNYFILLDFLRPAWQSQSRILPPMTVVRV